MSLGAAGDATADPTTFAPPPPQRSRSPTQKPVLTSSPSPPGTSNDQRRGQAVAARPIPAQTAKRGASRRGEDIAATAIELTSWSRDGDGHEKPLDDDESRRQGDDGGSRRDSHRRGEQDGYGTEADDGWSAFGSDDDNDDDMDHKRANFHRTADSKFVSQLHSHAHSQPLLGKGKEEEERRSYDAGAPLSRSGQSTSARGPVSDARRSTLRRRSPVTAAKQATRTKYTYAAFFLGLSLVAFVVQTETAVYIQKELGWDKAYCMLYLTHGSWSLLWPTQLLILRIRDWRTPWKVFWRRHVQLLRTTAQMVETQDLTPPRNQRSPVRYMLRITAFVTCSLTVAGGAWYVAVDLTSPSDLTAIYNCSAFFAYAFSVPMLKEKLRLDKSFAVLVAIVGVLVVAYGDSTETKHGGHSGGAVGGGDTTGQEEPKDRLAGNLIIGVGSVLYGFYEVLYKKVACPPEGVDAQRSMIFANTVGSLIGSFTLLVLWIPLPILHVLHLERFALPHGEAASTMLISVLANATFSGSFLVLMSLTSPVLSSVAALLTIFLVAITDKMWFGTDISPAAIAGGLLIVGAFLLLSWSTFKEMAEERRRKEMDALSEASDLED